MLATVIYFALEVIASWKRWDSRFARVTYKYAFSTSCSSMQVVSHTCAHDHMARLEFSDWMIVSLDGNKPLASLIVVLGTVDTCAHPHIEFHHTSI